MTPFRSISACIIGNVLEWYEFSLFVYLAPTIAKLFFPAENYITSLMLTFLVFASGFIIRPFSAIILGYFGDRVGRAKTLKATILLLSVSSIVTGCLPVYASVGIVSTLLLVVCRLVQGFCIGGEFAGAMIYLTESARPKRRAFVSAMTNNGSNTGILLAIAACMVFSHALSPAAFTLYGWRLLFILGGLLGLVGLWLRRDMSESDVFKAIQEKARQKYTPISYVIRHQWRRLFGIFFILVISACGSYVLMGYLSTYLNVFLSVPLSKAYQIQTLFTLASLLLVPVFGYLNDRYGRRPVMLFSLMGYLLLTLPIFEWLQFSVSVWVLLPLAVFYSAEQASTPVIISEMLPGKGRYTGVSIAYNLAMTLIGGTAGFLNTALIRYFHDNMMIAFYIMACAFISGVFVLFFFPQDIGYQSNLAKL